jgi:hypothetical protein
MKRNRASRERDRRPAQTRGKRRGPSPAEKRRESEDIERAVYDGMQDLRKEREQDR